MDKDGKVLIIDDHPLFRDALELALKKSELSESHIESVESISDALKAIGSDSFKLILLDLNLSDAKDFEGLTKILAHTQAPVIVVSATESNEAYQTSQALGASGYIPKSNSLDDIVAQINSVASGAMSFPDTDGNVSEDQLTAAEKIASLTPAQRRVINCLSDGLLNKQIAYEMGISEATVKAHMTAIFRKLDANNRTQALLVYRDATQLV